VVSGNVGRRFHDFLTSKSDGNASEAMAADDADRLTTEPLDDADWGLDVLVEGLDPVVDYVPSLCPVPQ
jgi:hypothetical protein